MPVFNNLEYTKEAVRSILDYTDIPYELIIIDNNSTDGTVEWLKELRNEMYIKDGYIHTIISNTENKGFPAAVNQGIKIAVGNFICILNNDIIVTDGWLENMLRYFEADKEIGIVGPLSTNISGRQLDQDFNYDVELGNERHYELIKNHAKKIHENNFGEVLFFDRVIGHIVIKRAVIDALGGYDERFSPGNYEDDDLCLRSRLAGFKSCIAQDVFVYHFKSKTFSKEPEKYRELLATNHMKFINKWGIDAGAAAYGVMPIKFPELKVNL